MARIRGATLADLGLLVEHRQRMWQAMARFTADEHARASAAYRRWLRPRLGSGSAAAFVVEGAGGRPLASGVVWLQGAQPRPSWGGTRQAYLMSVFTEPDERRKGHATRITRAAVRWAKARGVDRMALHASEAGAHVYRKLGFSRTHEMRLEF
jgi:GNAT superfamily N-acetyltransferase